MITTRTQWALCITDGQSKDQFIRKTGGEWGPSHLPTNDLTKAMKFDSYNSAASFLQWESKGMGWKIKIVKVFLKVTLTP